MLLGEDLGRRHERDLIAALDRVERGEDRDDRLAATDIALHEAVHRMGLPHVAGDLAEHALLRAGQAEGQSPAEPAAELAARAEGDAGLLGDRMLAKHHAELEEEELVEDDRAVRLGDPSIERPHVCVAAWLVDVGESGRQVDEAASRGDVGRKHAREELPDLGPRLVHDLPHRSHRHLGRLLVDRYDPAELVLGALEHLDLGVNHLPPAVAGFELTMENDSRTGLQLLLEVADLMEPRERQYRAAVARLRLEDAPPAPAGVGGADGDDLRGDGGFRSRHELRDRRQRTAVLVTERQVIENVLDRADAEACELLRPLRADALHELRRRGEQRECRAEVAVRRRIRRGGHGRLLQTLDLAQPLRGAPMPHVFGVEREVGHQRAQSFERPPICPAFFCRPVDELEDPRGRQRVRREPPRMCSGEVAQRRLDDAQQLIDRGNAASLHGSSPSVRLDSTESTTRSDGR